MSFHWIRTLFTPNTVRNPIWDTMEKMDPLLSFDRFLKLDLTEHQRPQVEGLIAGTLKPCDIDAVHQWATRHGEDVESIDALAFALQHILESDEVTYLFEDEVPFPVARFFDFVAENAIITARLAID